MLYGKGPQFHMHPQSHLLFFFFLPHKIQATNSMANGRLKVKKKKSQYFMFSIQEYSQIFSVMGISLRHRWLENANKKTYWMAFCLFFEHTQGLLIFLLLFRYGLALKALEVKAIEVVSLLSLWD